MPPTPWLQILVLLGAGFLLLAKGAGWLVSGSTQVARRLGLSVLFVGLTVVAFGTSAPEIVVSSLAAFRGQGGMSLGNVLGSNVANIGLVLGSCAIVLPRVLETHLSHRELFWLFASVLILGWVISDGAIERIEGAFLLLMFFVFNAHLMITARDHGPPTEALEEKPWPWFWVLVGVVSVSLGAKLTIDGAVAGATRLGIPDQVVGLTVLAVGTSLPELAAGLSSAFKGESEISLGNVVGSNVFNLLAAIGLVAVIRPLTPATFGDRAPALEGAFQEAKTLDLPLVLAFSLAMVLLPRLARERGRTCGFLLLAGYAGYVAWLYVTRG